MTSPNPTTSPDDGSVSFDANDVIQALSSELADKTVENAMLKSALKKMRADFVGLSQQLAPSEGAVREEPVA